MVKARNPLPLVAVVLGTVLMAGLAARLEIDARGRGAVERWRARPELVEFAQAVASAAMVTGSVALGIVLVLAAALHLGWEPRFLQQLHAGATVIGKEPDGWVEFRLENGRTERFRGDREEAAGLRVGDVVHLRVIPPYIASYRHVPESAAAEIRDRSRSFLGIRHSYLRTLNTPVTWQSWIFMLLAPVILGWCLAQGCFLAATGEFATYIIRRRRFISTSQRDGALLHESGPLVHALGIAMVVAGLLGLAWLVWQWVRGWDDSITELGL